LLLWLGILCCLIIASFPKCLFLIFIAIQYIIINSRDTIPISCANNYERSIFTAEFNIYTLMQLAKNIVLLALLVLLFSFNNSAECQDGEVSSSAVVELKSSNLPIIIINTGGKTIVDEPKVIVDMGIIDNGGNLRNNISDPYTFTGKIGIEIRGSSSQMFPKKQYGVETVDSTGEDINVSLLGLPEESDWVFSAPYTDKSLMRNVLMYKLSNSIGRYASRSKYFELVINNEYKGIYVLFEKIKRDKNRVNISKLNPEDTTAEEISGGYIIKIDKDEGNPNRGWLSPFRPYNGSWQRIYYQYDTPGPDEIDFKQETYIQHFINDFESVMSSKYYADPETGYEFYIDGDSFVDFFLMNELSKNVDGFRLSSFFHKDKDKDDKVSKLIAGPVWDYNLAFGNADYYDASLIPGFYLLYLADTLREDPSLPPFWWKVLFNDEKFHNKINKRWNELRKNEFSLTTINSYIDSVVTLLDEAKTRNFQKWPVLGQYIWPNYFIGKTYPDEIAYLKSWVRRRAAWLDEQFPALPDDVQEDEMVANKFHLYQNYPNPFNPSTTIDITIETRDEVTLKIFDLLGNEITTLLNKEMNPGKHSIIFNASDYPSGVYFARLQSGTRQETTKIMLLK